MRFEGLAGWIGTAAVGIALVGGFVLALNEHDWARSGDETSSPAQRSREIVLPSLAELERERDAAQQAYRQAEATGRHTAISSALDRLDAAARRYNAAKLRNLEGP